MKRGQANLLAMRNIQVIIVKRIKVLLSRREMIILRYTCANLDTKEKIQEEVGDYNTWDKLFYSYT